MPSAAARYVATALLAAGVTGASTQSRPDVSALAQLDCSFAVASSGSWDEPQARVTIQRAGPLEFRIGSIDGTRGTSEFLYGATSVPSSMLVGGSTVHFIEPPSNGTMALASVVVTGRDAKRFQASYTRTEYYAYDGPGFASVPRAEQYYGYCIPTFR